MTNYDHYNKISEVFSEAFDRVSQGKGSERHATNEPFEQQELCRSLREFGIAPAVYQIRKKAQESMRLDDWKASEEMLDIIIYATAAYIVLYEKLPTKTIEPDYPLEKAKEAMRLTMEEKQTPYGTSRIGAKTNDC